ncbi:MAG: tetratricopeptide repeat-containing sulfotransferase family protein [Rhizomicrobium sp.]
MEQVQQGSEFGPLWNILAGAAQVLESNPEEAGRQAEQLLNIAPGQQQALQLLVDARRADGDLAGARARLEAMAAELPDVAAVHCELGLLLIEAGDLQGAIRSLSRVVELEPRHPRAWRALGDALVQAGDITGAAKAYAEQFASSITDLKVLEQVSALERDQLEVADNVLREFLSVFSTDLTALQMLGRMHMRATQFESAENVFTRALEIAPGFQMARLDLISALHQQLRPEDENRQLDIILQEDPDNPEYRSLKAVALTASGSIEEAITYCEDMLRTEPERYGCWLAYAHALRVAGRENECIAAFRKAIGLQPDMGEAWLGLSNLKTFRFDASDVHAMRAELARKDLTDQNRQFLQFALGKALEDSREYEESFVQYSRGNALIRAANPYNVTDVAENVSREKRRYTREFFAANAELGCASAAPIFILGLPRSGSTLVEQILASHSMIEGGGELPSLTALVRRIESRRDDPAEDAAALFTGESLKAIGEEYLERCRRYRKLPRPYFTDKMPSNFHHLGFICAILPNARIIDARRHPLACCFSNFKQVFPHLQGPSYDLSDIGHYYRAYVELLAHFDRVLPGRIHRVTYEDLVREPEREVRRLLQYCDLPFEDTCLRFYETDRGIRTISSAQVRRPLYNDSVAHWRNYEPWLGPLKAALGTVLDAYPAVRDES